MSAERAASDDAEHGAKLNGPTAVGGTHRANRPQPLQLHNDQTAGRPRTMPNLTLDELLQLMGAINASVKAGDFSGTLAQQIFRLCHQLKISGECLEHSHKNDLNRVMVSLRQACCRDNGSLGTPCRLKIMEIVELRAMGWRPSLAHSQYYLNRQQPGSDMMYAGVQPMPAAPYQPPQHGLFPHIPGFGASVAPGSAPPFGAIPFNPFALPTTLSDRPALPAAFPPPVSTSAGYYVIPASAGLVPAAFVMPPASPLVAPPPQSAVSPPGALNGDVDPQWWARGGVLRLSGRGATVAPTGTPKTPKTPGGKSPGFREEIVIRNGDSGKLMGVRGRRVAIVEQLSKTVISFQKVEPGEKERGLSISGDTEEAIEHAKALIEETIRRNVSPRRPDGEQEHTIEVAERHKAILQDIEWHTESDGSLRLSCADPAALQMAQDALKQYLQQVSDHRTLEKTKSGPTTLGGDDKGSDDGKGRPRYDRSAVLACAASPVARLPPDCLLRLATEAPDILRPDATPFDVAQYELALAATR